MGQGLERNARFFYVVKFYSTLPPPLPPPRDFVKPLPATWINAIRKYSLSLCKQQQ